MTQLHIIADKQNIDKTISQIESDISSRKIDSRSTNSFLLYCEEILIQLIDNDEGTNTHYQQNDFKCRRCPICRMYRRTDKHSISTVIKDSAGADKNKVFHAPYLHGFNRKRRAGTAHAQRYE